MTDLQTTNNVFIHRTKTGAKIGKIENEGFRLYSKEQNENIATVFTVNEADFCQNKDVANSNLHNLQINCSPICGVSVYYVKLEEKV